MAYVHRLAADQRRFRVEIRRAHVTITFTVIEAPRAEDHNGARRCRCRSRDFGGPFPSGEAVLSTYPIHTLVSAPEASRPSLEALQSNFGFVPNVVGTMATSSVLIASLVALFSEVHGGNFTEPQIQILLLTNAVTNNAEWAVAFHTTLALEQGVARTDIEAIRSRGTPSEPKFAALSLLARTLIEKRGKLDAPEIDAFIGAGFGPEHLLEGIAVSAASAITNYTANVTRPPLEVQFREHAWHAA